MRIQIVLAVLLGIAVEMISSAKKGYRCHKPSGIQAVDIDNDACASANSIAINAGWCGDANSAALASATNANCVEQKMK
jgi:hypothetical protein